ncbi:hypothetical protein TNCT_102601 [Trichonephila clavata]|uniref:Uncharacterized protein n=1 Tax=Trichonephila clavata TaxID=2740835 RepID=A0A8X6JJY5_TRICU|nr:hypothetical protein TNCT_102601 [Trichonephila clavata]
MGATTFDLDTPGTTHGGQPGTSRALPLRWQLLSVSGCDGDETWVTISHRIEGRIYGVETPVITCLKEVQDNSLCR